MLLLFYHSTKRLRLQACFQKDSADKFPYETEGIGLDARSFFMAST